MFDDILYEDRYLNLHEGSRYLNLPDPASEPDPEFEDLAWAEIVEILDDEWADYQQSLYEIWQMQDDWWSN